MNDNNGTGLGLYISKNILTKMNGNINFIQKDIEEIEVRFNIPIILKINKTILIVDDFIGILSTKMLLETNGFVVTLVKSGKSAIEKCVNHTYDIILIDKHLNGLSGVETVKKLRSNGYTGVIYGFTGDCFDNKNDTFGSKNEVSEVFYKPLNIKTFISKCEKI